MPDPRNHQRRANATAYAHVIQRLIEGDATRDDLAEYSGLHKVTVGHIIRAFRRMKRPKIIYVSDYAPDGWGRMCIEMFTLGDKPDVKKPVRTRQEIVKAYNERKKLREQQKELREWISPGSVVLDRGKQLSERDSSNTK